MEYRGLRLDPFQSQAIDHLQAGKSVLVCAPTGTGKTIIADWIVDEALRTGKKVIYTAPIKALSNQKYRDYTRLYGDEAVGLVTGDQVIRRNAPCLIMTTEILRNILLAGEPVEDLLAVIIDEIHFVDDRERGTVWEEVLIYLPPEVQIVGLSATLANLDEFADWLSHVRGSKIEVIVEERRAVPLTMYFAAVETGIVEPKQYEITWRRKGGRSGPPQPKERPGRNGGGRPERSRRPQRHTTHLDLFLAARDEFLTPYLYFVFSRRETEVCARALARKLRESLLNDDERVRLRRRLDAAAVELGPVLDQDLRQMLEMGVGFHHAGAHVLVKALVESLYEEKLLHVLYCTSTFAIGINMPARTVIFDGVMKFDGRGTNPLTTREFMQMAGRAGRRGKDEIGHVAIRVDFEEYENLKPQLEAYLRGRHEPVRSSFNLSWNSVVSLLKAHPMERIREITDRSFLNWHLNRQKQLAMEKAVELDNAEGGSDRKAARRLRRKAEKEENRVWSEFQQKLKYLQSIGYLEEDLSFAAGANALLHVQIAEIFVTELLLSGILEGLPMSTLFGAMCAMTNDLPRHVARNYVMNRDDRALAKDIDQIRRSPPVAEAERLAGQPVTWDETLLTLGRLWAEGTSLAEILLLLHSETDVSGDLINGFRRAKDLASQIGAAWGEIPGRRDQIRELIRKVSRDEVEVVG